MGLIARLSSVFHDSTLRWQFFRFGVVGGTSAVINYLVYELCILGFGVWYVAAGVIAYGVAAVANFTGNKLWTFADRSVSGNKVGFGTQVGKFLMVIGVGMVLTSILIYLGTEVFGLRYRWSWLFANGLVTVWNFSGHRLWTFRQRSIGLPVREA